LQVKVCLRYQRHLWQFAAGINDTSGKFATGSTTPAANFATRFPGVVDTGGKFATGVNNTAGNLPPLSTTPAANLPPMSMKLVANNGNNIRLLRP
jgi:hypothetical protein